MDIGKVELPVFLMLAAVIGVRAETEAGDFKTAEAKAHYQKALEYENKGIWPAAVLELNQARQREPENPAVLTELGIAHAERKEWKQALTFLRKAVALAPGSVQAHYNLALTLDRADPAKGAGAAEYRKALKADPRHVDTLINLGVDLGDQNPAEARQLFERAIRVAPNNANAHLNLALLLKRETPESASVSEFRQAIRLNPDLVEARRQLAALLMSQQQWTQVIEQCREILKREPEDASTQYTIGQALIRNGQTEEGKKALEQAQTLRKRHQETQEAQELQNAGVRDLSAGKSTDATKALSAAVRLDPSSANHMYLGLALAASGAVKSGMQELATALELDPKNARTHLNLGSVYLQNGQEFLAKTEFEKALQIDPWFAEAHNNLGLILSKSNQADRAEEHFRLAADLDPQYLEAIFNLGLSLRALSRLDGALAAFRRAAELAPDNAQVQYALGLTLKDKGDLRGAQTALDRAASLERRSK
jgi:tetratricopeptide (TPR) repeat protein